MEVSDFARARMTRAGITLDQVHFLLQNSTENYPVNKGIVHKGQLPDGKLVKVRVKEGNVVEDVICLRGDG